MANKLQFKRCLVGSDISSYTPAEGEPIFDLNKKQLRIGDGTTAGGLRVSGDLTTDILADDHSAEAGSVVMVDCRTKEINVTLPDNPENGATVKVVDVYYAASEEHSVVVTAAGKINDENESFIIDVPRAYVGFTYVAATQNWIVDLGGVILPSYEIATTDELEWTDAGQLGIKQVAFEKIVGPMDLGEF